jgi:hypothetical protein
MCILCIDASPEIAFMLAKKKERKKLYLANEE